MELWVQCLTYDNSINIVFLIATGRRKGVTAGGMIVGPNASILSTCCTLNILGEQSAELIVRSLTH